MVAEFSTNPSTVISNDCSHRLSSIHSYCEYAIKIAPIAFTAIPMPSTVAPLPGFTRSTAASARVARMMGEHDAMVHVVAMTAAWLSPQCTGQNLGWERRRRRREG